MGSVARVANSYHDKNSRNDKKLAFKFGRYIYHRYIYISRPPSRETDRQMYRLSIERIFSIFKYKENRGIPPPSMEGVRELYIYIDILIILSIDNLYICLSVPLAGRSRCIDISIIYILFKHKY